MSSFALDQGFFVAIGGEEAALEEVVVALKRIYGCELGIDTRRFAELLQLVAKVSGDSLPRFKAFVGENAFTHEFGIHVDSLLKEPKTYESLAPEDVGRQHRFVVGKHSEPHLVCNLLREHDVELGKEEAPLVLVSIPNRDLYNTATPTIDTIPHSVRQGVQGHI